MINGRKRWPGNAVWCDVIVVFARDTADGQVKAFVVEKDNPGYAASKIEGKVSLRMTQNADIILTSCRVSEDARLQNCNSFADVTKVLKSTRNTVAWGSAGHGVAAYDIALNYAQRRTQPGAPRRARPANRQRAAKRSDSGPSGSYGSTSIAPANVTRADVAFPLAALPGGMATMRSWIDHAGEVVWEPAPSLIAQLVEAGQPFWLDIENPTDELIDQLATRLGLHPLAVEDSKQFGQRAKLKVYGHGVMLVGFGLDEQLREPVEVHCYYTTGFLIRLRRAPSPALHALRQGGSVQPQLGSDPIRALHPLISSLYTQFSALVLELDQRLDALEQRVLREADDQELAEITAIRHRAAVIRRSSRQAGTSRPGRRSSSPCPAPPAKPSCTPKISTTSCSKSWPASPRSRSDVPPCWSCTPRSQASTWRS